MNLVRHARLLTAPALSAALLICASVRGSDWISIPGGRTRSVAPQSTRPVGFTRLEASATGITFTNILTDAVAAQNQIRLNGSGVAAGDIDGDGLVDLYFSGLEGPNVLYRNLGNWKFQDITESAGVALPDKFGTGCMFADVDGDGDLDLLAGSVGDGVKLFLNDGKGRFTEVEFSGLQEVGCATTLAMADIDGDGDLDLYVANYRTTTIRSTGISMMLRNGRKELLPEDREGYEITREGKLLENGEPHFLYENRGGKFFPGLWTDGRFLDENGAPLTKQPRDWGLTATFHDINGDGLPDIYVCNDFHSPDRIWINQGKGIFRALPTLALRNTSTFSMGIDFADINRDGFDDFFVADMLDPDRRRRMMQLSAMEPSQSIVGVYRDRPQFDRNTLQLNRGDGTFSEIAFYAGLEASGWTWCPVFLDVDLDGYEDLLMTCGHMFDTQDLDAADRIEAAGPYPRAKIPGKLLMYPRLLSENTAFRNLGNLHFTNSAFAWGFNYKGVSHGMILADLDNDGDLDVVFNALNGPAGIYRNESAAPRVAVRLKGEPPNTQGIGARIFVTGGPTPQAQEVIAGGRYLSGAEPTRVFAAGNATELKIVVKWRSGKVSEMTARPNQIVEVDELQAKVSAPESETKSAASPALFEEVANFAARHLEDDFDDFNRQPLLPWKLSQEGPGLTWFDLNGDGWEDLVVPSGRGGRLAIFQNAGGKSFNALTNFPTTPRDQLGSVGSAGTKLLLAIANYQDGLPIGDRVVQIDHDKVTPMLPAEAETPGPIALGDVDGDGDLDLFVGGRALPGRYGEPASSAIYLNKEGRLIRDAELSKLFQSIGLVNGATFSDIDGDGRADLVLAMEWEPVRVFLNTSHGWREATAELKLANFVGWWQGVATGDFNGDGRMDIVASNWGLNTKYRATAEHPRNLYVGDVDASGTIDLIEVAWDSSLGEEASERELNTMRAGIPMLRERFPNYKSYASAGLQAAFGAELPKMQKLSATTLETTLFLNEPGGFRAVPLPPEAQFAPAFGVSVADFDGDGAEDIFLAQNFFALPPEGSRADAGRGLLLLGDGKGGFHATSALQSGIRVYGEQRGCAAADFDHDGRTDLAVGQNGAEVKLFHNVLAKPGLRVLLRGTKENPDAIGATIQLGSNGKWGPAREVKAGGGYRSQDAFAQVMSFAPRPQTVRVRWPGGKTTETPVPSDAKEISLKAAN